LCGRSITPRLHQFSFGCALGERDKNIPSATAQTHGWTVSLEEPLRRSQVITPKDDAIAAIRRAVVGELEAFSASIWADQGRARVCTVRSRIAIAVRRQVHDFLRYAECQSAEVCVRGGNVTPRVAEHRFHLTYALFPMHSPITST
jgi:hypothetical protein